MAGQRVKNRIFECCFCHIKIKNKISNLRRHMRLHNPRVKCFKCLECLKKYQNKQNFQIHWANNHAELGDPKVVQAVRKSKGKQH